ncbi:structural maintenance of chromosomes protein 6 [Entomortierella parvispora]|uniref:Structural maintenance of chromosomes protein 6 n=1 Tax=Entomortierella parvispora TaxID=205924 RepID=A0A9P3HD06_9FUNG|nr:structural maintenance of chromosomes protein 6 [Entomortierella parvispora]
MPESRKRRLIQDEEDEIDDHVQDIPERTAKHAKTGSRQQANGNGKAAKKSRRATESDHSAEEEEDDEDEEVTEREEPEGWGEVDPSQTQDELDWKKRAALEFQRSTQKTGRHGMVAEMGVIELIEMFDFMCHRHLKVPFGPKINFIIGHNGSGKSAILTAIIVCLGGKANATNRAQNLKALIREGASQTDVKLQLRNRGPDAFKPELYGESIIIERRISRDGSSGYKIKSAKGKTISTKREELAAMCDHMNIQVDNPMNVLSQDTAKQFLQASTGEDKYKFFSRGTQLTQLSIDYETIRECIYTMQRTLENKKDSLTELFDDAKAAQARFKDMQAAATLELKVQDMKNQVAWGQIEELEKGVRTTEDKLDGLKARIPGIEAKRAKEDDIINELAARIQELEKSLAEHTTSGAPSLEQKRTIEHKMREKRNEYKQVQDEEKTVNDEIKSLKEQIAEYERKIELTRKQQATAISRRAEAVEKISRLEEENERSKRQLAEARESSAQIEQKSDDCRDRQDALAKVTNKLRGELSESRDRIKQIEAQKQNALRAFGPAVPDILRDIEQVTRRGGWRGSPPVGPLGRHVKLREEKWAQVLESALGGVLNAFAVTEDADRTTLMGIMRKYNWKADVIRTKRVIFDYSHKEPSTRFLTINRILDFDDEWVRRLLIDKNSIESTILVEQRQEADRITSSGPNGGFPEGVSQCFTVDLIRVGDRSGGASSLMMRRYNGPPRLSKNVEGQLQVLQARAEQVGDSLRQRMKESEALMSELASFDRERMVSKRQQQNLEKDLKLKTRAIEDLRATQQEEDTTGISAYEDAKQTTLEQIETMKKQYEPVAVQKQAILAEMEPLKEGLKEINESIRRKEEESVTIRSDLDRLNLERQDKLPRVLYWENKLNKEQRDIEQLQIELSGKTKYLEESTAKAVEYCDRVEVTASVAQLERDIKQMQERLREQEEQRGATLEEIALDMQRKQDLYKTSKLAIHQMEVFVKQLKMTLNNRLSRWREFRAQMSLRSKINFGLQLSQRGYSGELEFHHSEKKLTIRVETEDQRTAKAGVARDKDPKSLSGGEKSFSTICLLLALWDSMASSIRCLDEFDVFMDAVNRRISMQMLIDTARESDGVQYILITPQDASSVSPGPDVRVHRLHDPERNQQTIA